MEPSNPSAVKGCLLFLCGWILSGTNLSGATFSVINTSGSGAGSLRAAMLAANAAPGLDTIRFQIPGSGIKTILPGSALPAITSPVVIDGTTQPGYAGTPLIEIDGANGVNNAGLKLTAGNSTIRGLAIIRFLWQGIEISGTGTNLVAGNFIGLGASGTTGRPNKLQGVWINGSFGNLIGGTTLEDRNVISGNTDSGIYILGGAGNTIRGNYIGTKADGNSALENGANGVSIYNSGGNQVGGAITGAGNVISANAASGVYMKDTSGNFVQGNRIGLGADGTTLLGNTADGITINNAGGNMIGGTSPKVRNVISGNLKSGISISGTATSNQVQGNFIGTDYSGVVWAGNSFAGVTLSRTTNNTIGGTIYGARNVISGNQADGIFLSTNSVGNVVAGNYIGLDVTGSGVLSNAYNGVTVSSAYNNIIRDANVISGNGFDGVNLANGATGNIVQGNYIGTDASGTAAMGNRRSGLGIDKASANRIGSGGAGNVISGNGDAGVFIVGATAVGNIVKGNRIGTDPSGAMALGNFSEGIYIRQSPSNVIGGALAADGNVISANGTWGISLTNTDWNIIQGNTIGTALDRVTPLGNSARSGAQNSGFHTVELTAGCLGNAIGGSTPGAGNLIAHTPARGGVYYAGVRIRDGATNNPVMGNQFVGNAGLGIDLGPYLVNANDNCDGDTGANQSQNFPALTQVVTGNGTGIFGTLSSKPNTAYRLEFFASAACNAFGNGEGEIYLGSKEISTSSSCSAEFTVQFPTVPAGYRITATATDPNNNTSEFSACAQAVPVPTLAFSKVGASNIRLAWPANLNGFAVRQTDSLTPPISWSPVTNPVVSVGGEFTVMVPFSETKRFFLLSLE